jgi:aldehyde:ferredoxin oxidoreductase
MNEQIWRVDVPTGQVHLEPVPDRWQRLGGRGLTVRILLDEISPLIDPLSPAAKLVFAPGLLSGLMLSSCDRLSIGCKSPLTGGIKESNAGGTTSLKMARLGIKALILQGGPNPAGWVILHLSKEGGHFEPAGHLQGLGVHETASLLREQYGPKVGLSILGPAGEMLLMAAGIQNLDKDGEPSRIAARGGTGAVLGVKKIKAIVFDDADCDAPELTDAIAYRQAAKIYTQTLMAQPLTKSYTDFGTSAMVNLCNTLGAMPTRGFSQGQFEKAESISGETLRERILERDGKGNPSHACMPGCTIRSSNVFPDREGKKLVSPLEYETIALNGSNLGIPELDKIAEINREEDDLGLDSIEIGSALGVAAQAGLMTFGDADQALALIGEIRRGSPLGRILGNGAAIAGKVLGVRRVPVVKGQAMSGYDPRAVKGTGVTYATSPQGADHTSGLTIRAKVNHLDPRGQAELSRSTQFNMAGFDTLGACIFTGAGFMAAPESIPNLLRARYGWDLGENTLEFLGRQTIRMEREFNRLAGFTSADDRIPEWMTEEPLAPNNVVFDVPDHDLDTIFDTLEDTPGG